MFNILDAILVLFIIICVLVGMRRGFVGSVAKLLSGLLRLVISILLAKPFVTVISLTKIDEHLFDNLSGKFSSISDKFNVNLAGMGSSELNTFVGDALADAKIPKLFRGFFINIFSIEPETIAVRGEVTLAELMGVAVSNIILLCVSFVSLLVLLWLLSKLIMKWSKRTTKGDTVFAKTNKWLGAIFGLIKSFIFLFFVFIIVSFLKDFTFMQNITEFINGSFLGRCLLNISQMLIDSSFDLKRLLENWLTKG